MNDPVSEPATDEITLTRSAVVVTAKLLDLAHKQGFFSKFSAEEAMRHLSVVVYLQEQLGMLTPKQDR